MLANAEAPSSGEVDVGCVRESCVDHVSSDVGFAVCLIYCACFVRCVVVRVVVRDGFRIGGWWFFVVWRRCESVGLLGGLWALGFEGIWIF